MKSDSHIEKVISRIGRMDRATLVDQLVDFARSRDRDEAIFESLQEGVLVVNEAGVVTYANPAVEQMLGFEFNRRRGILVARILPDVDWASLVRLGEDGNGSSCSTAEIEVFHPDRRILSFYAFPLRGGAEDAAVVDADAADSTVISSRGVVAILRDVTRERSDAAEAMESEKMEAVRMLVSSLAHEIGNPLNNIGLQLQLLKRACKRMDENSPERKQFTELLDTASSETGRLTLLLGNFLRAMRSSETVMNPCNLCEVIATMLQAMKADIDAHNIHVNLSVATEIPMILGDAEQLKQVFFNLLKNAVQAMPTGGTIDVQLSADDRDVSVALRDSGSGIAPEDFQRIFQPFHTSKSDGHGIGLTIVTRIVQAHGGRIDLSSREGEGACFRIVFPRAERRTRLLH